MHLILLRNLTYITQKMIPDGIFNYNDTFDHFYF